MCIIRYGWLISLYLFISLVHYASFLSLKTVVSGKNSVIFHLFFRHNCNKSLWKNIFLVSFHSRTSPLFCAPPQLSLSPSPTTFVVDNSQRFRFDNSQSPNKLTGNPNIKSPDKFTGKTKTQINIYIYI